MQRYFNRESPVFGDPEVIDLCDSDNDSDTDTMGRAYRTPSPAREAYISSSNVNSPQRSREASKIISSERKKCQQRDSQNHGVKDACLEDVFNTQSQAGSETTANDTPMLDDPEEPKTPTKKRFRNLWHGLPSPDTPTFQNSHGGTISVDVSNTEEDTQSIDEDDSGDDKDVAMTQDTMESDAILAHELGARRSTRLCTLPRPNYILKPTVPRTVQKQPSSPKPESSVVATIESDPIAFHGLPALLSTEWELQYPPGGSTHPSYPYPNLDPRLIFHQSHVPITEGLPDYKRVPKLVLPMGWKHVSWSGLLPIAFDPYHQGFKLTPVGPMPLTCEELHQGGLHKYVPGGELHPEYGMLPDMRKFSDGSDAEVYNFDGVDWTLPWSGNIDFHPAATNDHGDDYRLSPAAFKTPVVVIVHPWNENRDCPDKIFDVSDAWRWLTMKETNPAADFIPNPDRKWIGSGAYRSKRKLKSPIPELLMLVLQPTESSPVPHPNALLQNQDTGLKGANNFCPFKSVATTANVDITLLGDTEFTVLELLAYFPHHYNWGHAAERLARAGVGPTSIRGIIVMMRGLKGDEITPSSVSSATKVAKKRDLAKAEEMDVTEADKDTPAPAPMPASVIDISNTYTAEGWKYDVWEKTDYPLLALAHGLQMLPSGPDAGPLTALILWCRQNERYQALLSEVPSLLKEAEIEPLIEPGENGCPDKEVVERHAEALKKDRVRIATEAELAKRAAVDAGEEKMGGGKKRQRMN
ncbi:hypothetical protein GMOD_00009207 [Pyrenophora seminiperda CCB06]|uniref:Uncharacterized protein n=1 Tax=Pyrenophora seminiperda CCB06 TaxID=1302712 RepID=A0A3M7MBU1_9PLEO|nr:hypothetical protein GMOD_00009207 [Pyrenophora seminiperda CCB06]